MGKLQINILGTSFQVKASSESDEYLNKLLKYYKEICNTIQNASQLKDNLQISILAGITLVDELYKQKKENAVYEQQNSASDAMEAERITLEMINKINDALNSTKSNENK